VFALLRIQKWNPPTIDQYHNKGRFHHVNAARRKLENDYDVLLPRTVKIGSRTPYDGKRLIKLHRTSSNLDYVTDICSVCRHRSHGEGNAAFSSLRRTSLGEFLFRLWRLTVLHGGSGKNDVTSGSTNWSRSLDLSTRGDSLHTFSGRIGKHQVRQLPSIRNQNPKNPNRFRFLLESRIGNEAYRSLTVMILQSLTSSILRTGLPIRAFSRYGPDTRGLPVPLAVVVAVMQRLVVWNTVPLVPVPPRGGLPFG